MLNEKNQALSSYRLERAKEYIKDAKQLYEAGSYRSGNNRAYYAVFDTMRAVLALDGVDFKKHSGVIQYFQREYIKSGTFDKIYSDIIMEASEVRNASDYDDFYLASKQETLEQIEGAEKLWDAVDAYLKKYIEQNK